MESALSCYGAGGSEESQALSLVHSFCLRPILVVGRTGIWKCCQGLLSRVQGCLGTPEPAMACTPVPAAAGAAVRTWQLEHSCSIKSCGNARH